MLAEKAGDFAVGAGQPARARQAYGLAREHWAALGKTDRAREVDGKITGETS